MAENAVMPPAVDPVEFGRVHARPRTRAAALVPSLIAVGLMLVWAVHDGGYDEDTWYWGALVLLATFSATLGLGIARPPSSRAAGAALTAFGLYVGWSYLSIAWAQSPGNALEGSNRALLYLLVFILLLTLPWTREAVLVVLVTFALALGLIATVILLRLASHDHIQQLVTDGRLTAPTGYFNSSVALFMSEALLATALAARRGLPAVLRGTLIGFACVGLQLAVIGQSRGWLFTLPLVAIASLAVLTDRVRFAAASVLPILAAVLPARSLLNVFKTHTASALEQAAASGGRSALLVSAAMLVVGTLVAVLEASRVPPSLSRASRRRLGGAMAILAFVVAGLGGLAATHGDPFGFLKRQWQGFSHPSTLNHPSTSRASGSHFATVGSGRYDFWRVSWDAVASHPIGGLGQDNFADYYVTRRRTAEEPQWTHSLEMRLLAHTGFVGFGLFAAFLIAAVTGVFRGRRSGADRVGGLAGVALLPLVVWLIHGSVDWFWEVPALTGPALGFLAIACADAAPPATGRRVHTVRMPLPRVVSRVAAVLTLAVTVAVLGFPYLSVREVSAASDLRAGNPAAALKDLASAARLNPLSAAPGRLGGTIALQTGLFTEAERRFRQAIAREPGGWFAWLGDGLAASALGDTPRAQHDYAIAASINSRQLAVIEALARVDTTHPVTPAEAFQLLTLA